MHKMYLLHDDYYYYLFGPWETLGELPTVQAAKCYNGDFCFLYVCTGIFASVHGFLMFTTSLAFSAQLAHPKVHYNSKGIQLLDDGYGCTVQSQSPDFSLLVFPPRCRIFYIV